jgi:hypothetical protein
MKRLLLLLLLAGPLSACGWGQPFITSSGPIVTSHSGVVRVRPPSPTSLRFSTASNREFARQDVQKLLRIVVLPASARQVGQLPKSAPSRFGEDLTATRFAPGVAGGHRIWVVHEPLQRVAAFARAHAPARPRPEALFRGKNNGIVLRPNRSYPFPPEPGRTSDRWLGVEMAALPGGQTVVVAQATVAWVHPPPRSAELTARVKRIDIASRLGTGRPNVLIHLHKAYDVASLVAWMNGLGVAPRGIFCATVYVGGPIVTLRFRAADGTVLAQAQVSDPAGSGRSGPCNPLQLTVGGRKAPPLIGADLLHRIEQHFGVDLDPPTPDSVATCLRARGWKVRAAGHALSARKDGVRDTITFHADGKVTTNAPPRGVARCLRNRPGIVVYG